MDRRTFCKSAAFSQELTGIWDMELPHEQLLAKQQVHLPLNTMELNLELLHVSLQSYSSLPSRRLGFEGSAKELRAPRNNNLGAQTSWFAGKQKLKL